ncbi:hypothetical protein [Parerythrobacter aestuarii]|uniref:hypothetical protein n=1 Tax=Parerythrobacter aestuarii TaxID=3020909 RepID=UPI0024DE2D3C|nr:hypothetical protein [Parerythrobacter aestuarii]
MITLLADGADHHAAMRALERGWELVTPLPFGRALNAAINAGAATVADAEAILAGKVPPDKDTAARVAAIEALAHKARLFELAEQDEAVAGLLLAALGSEGPHSPEHERLRVATSRRASMAGQLLVEQADILIAVWDGQSVDSVGGTGHTVAAALSLGVPVVWIHPQRPEAWQIYHTAEEMAAAGAGTKPPQEQLALQVRNALVLDPPRTAGRFAGIAAIGAESWRDHSRSASHVYRRVEALFGARKWSERLASLRQRYERPEEIGTGSGKALLDAVAALPGQDQELAGSIEREILRRFAWSDGISSSLADRYRSGMVLNFILGAAAIIVGTLYLPLTDTAHKWVFAGLELALLLAIVANTARGQKRRFHGRWFESRRAAEYLRHSPFLVTLGVARAVGRWPLGVSSWWPEWYVRHTLSGIGLPQIRVGTDYLRGVLELLRDHHVDPQRSYHRFKSGRLEHVHHQLDRLSEYSFAAAVFFVGLYLVLAALGALGVIDGYLIEKSAKWFTVIAVALPTVGGAIAAIRYFADFERFAEISEATANELDQVAHRIEALLAAPAERLDFAQVAQIVHDTDDIVFSEIENWQAVFSGKRTTIPA